MLLETKLSFISSELMIKRESLSWHFSGVSESLCVFTGISGEQSQLGRGGRVALAVVCLMMSCFWFLIFLLSLTGLSRSLVVPLCELTLHRTSTGRFIHGA